MKSLLYQNWVHVCTLGEKNVGMHVLVLTAFSILATAADSRLILHYILQIDFQRHPEQRVKNVLSYIISSGYRGFKNHCDCRYIIGSVVGI